MGSKATHSPDRVKQDINFLEYPMWAVSKGLFRETNVQRRESSQSGSYKAFVYQKDDRFLVESIIGVPRLFDAVILIFLTKEVQQQDFLIKLENLTYYRILKGCGYSVTAKYYKKLEDTLDLWSSTTFRFFDSFYTKQPGHLEKHFSPIDSWGKNIVNGKKVLWVRMGEEFIEAIRESRYFKYIDFDEYRKFTSPLAARLSELLIKSFLRKNEWKINIFNLNEELTINEKYPSTVVLRLKSALKQVNKNSSKYFYEMSERDESDNIIFTRTEKDQDLEIPDTVLSLIPIKYRKDCRKVCLDLLKAEGEDSLFWHVKETSKRHKKGALESWGAWIKSMWKRGDYKAHKEKTKKQADDHKAAVTQAKKKLETYNQGQARIKADKTFRQREVIAMSDVEHEEYALWLESKGKQVNDHSKQMFLERFWEDINKSSPIPRHPSELGLLRF